MIITIIVMLILVGVTINFALNGGIITKAKQAGSQMQIEADRESLFSAVIASMGLDGKVDFDVLDVEAGRLGFTGSNGTYTSASGNTFTVDENGNIIASGSSNSNGSSSSGSSATDDTDLQYLRAMIGRNIFDLIEFDEDTDTLTFNDSNIIFSNENELSGQVDENDNFYYLIEYNGKQYTLYLTPDNNSNLIVSNIVKGDCEGVGGNSSEPEEENIEYYTGTVSSIDFALVINYDNKIAKSYIKNGNGIYEYDAQSEFSLPSSFTVYFNNIEETEADGGRAFYTLNDEKIIWYKRNDDGLLYMLSDMENSISKFVPEIYLTLNNNFDTSLLVEP